MSRNESTFLFPDTESETELHTASPTAYLLDEFALHGHRPGQDEPDPRPLPEPDAVHGQLDAMVEAFSAMLTGTRIEDDLADLLWSFVNCSTARPTASSVSSTSTNRRSAAARPSKTARR